MILKYRNKHRSKDKTNIVDIVDKQSKDKHRNIETNIETNLTYNLIYKLNL